MLSLFSALVLKSYEAFWSLWSRSFSVTAMLNNVDFSGKRNTAIHDLVLDVTAIANQQTRDAAQMMCYINAGPLSVISAHH